MEKKKGKGIETTVNLLPEPIIQHIQSFLNAKEAARTTLLSKYWYTAWLTRPSLDFDDLAWKPSDFEAYTAKTMQRYQDLNLNIQSFRLCIKRWREHSMNLIVNAIKFGATDLELLLPPFDFSGEVLESESIVRLNPQLKSLKLSYVKMRSADTVRNIISSCRASIEELSLCNSVSFHQICPYELHKLKRLFLDGMHVDNTFFSDFASKFPCLKNLSLVRCSGYTRIEIASNSLDCIWIVQPEKRLMDKFDVPNIRKFTYSYSGGGVPSLSIKVSSKREWDFDFSIKCLQFPGASWFLSMKRLLKKMRLSRIKISLSFYSSRRKIKHDEVNNDFRVVPKRVAVERLTIKAPTKFCSATNMLHLLGICCPKVITHFWLPEPSTSYAGYPRSAWKDNNESLGVLCNVLSANQNTFGLNEVKVEIYEKIHKDDQWRPLVLKGPLDASKTPVNISVVGFRLMWG